MLMRWGRFGYEYRLLAPPVVLVTVSVEKQGDRCLGWARIGVSAIIGGAPSWFCVSRCKVMIAALLLVPLRSVTRGGCWFQMALVKSAISILRWSSNDVAGIPHFGKILMELVI